ncbi:uroporphyrinogen-III synthase [Crenobacter cavernae]|uniref:Uroporphyrinogen-III synthase n=1 Tax=Crenobacter cavernae TaxID=2290923 RepID=A0A345Y4F6_9NEIS|nr:uroporphyrinogen-III synthase [Crenobacter cavernae]AXK38808.1 uroporphyrinogen-III synthase [Crenobacter cavernae]
MSLSGRTVLVTRPAGLAAPLAARLESAGATPLAFPVIELKPDAAALEALPRSLACADWVIPVSPSAIDFAADALGSAKLEKLRFACVGAASARRLAALTGKAIVHPAGETSDSAALLAEPGFCVRPGQRVLILRGHGGRPELADALTVLGASVSLAELYRRVDGAPDWAAFDAAVDAGTLAAALVTSGEIAERLFQLAGPARAEPLQSLLYGVPHPRIAERLAALGARHIVTTRACDDALVEGLQNWFSHQP